MFRLFRLYIGFDISKKPESRLIENPMSGPSSCDRVFSLMVEALGSV